MKQGILAAALAIVVTAAQAQGTNPNSHPVQAYTTLGPAGAGVYREQPPARQLQHHRQGEPIHRRRRHAESALPRPARLRND